MTITNSSTKLTAVVAGVAVALALMGAVAIAPAQAAGLSATQVQAIVSLLASFGADSATIANVTAALNGQATTGTGGSTTTTGGVCPTLSRSLSLGASGADVKSLQVFLNGRAATQVAISGAGSPGHETTYFGPGTKAAVMKFQTLNGVSAIGIVGPASRAAIVAVCGGTTGSTGGTGGTTGGQVTVSAGAQPVNSLAPQGANRVPFTTFSITNNSSAPVTVNSVTVQRTGLGVDSNFSGIVLLDSNGLQIGTAKTLNSNHQANIGDSGWTIAAGATQTYTVAGNIASASNVNGQVVSLQVVAVNTGATVSGSLPISGASQTINSTLTLGSVSTTSSAFDPGAAQTRNIGDVGVRFSGVKFTAGSTEDLKLYSVRWRQVGSASNVDISNLATIVAGTSYPATVDATGKYYTTIFPGGLLVTKGNSIDVYIQGDVTGSNAAGRTVDFDIDKVTDVYFVGQLYGYGIAPSGSYQPWYNGYVATINGGTVTTLSKANTGKAAAQNIAINVSNQPLGGFTTNFSGEPVSISGMTVTVATTTAAAGLLTSVSLVDENGTVVAGPVDATWVSTTQTLTFSDTVTFPTGIHSYYFQGKVASTATGGAGIALSTTPSGWTNPTGQSTGNAVSLSGTSAITMNTMTVKAGALTVAMSTTPSSQNIVSGVSNFTFANVNVDASQSGEDVRLASLPVYFTGNANNLSGCQMYDGSTALNTSSRVVNTVNGAGGNTKTTFSFDNVLRVPKGTIKTLAIHCNLSSAATSSTTYKFTNDSTAGDYSITGDVSGVSITPVVTASSGGTMTVQTASMTLAVDSSSPASTTLSGGALGQTLAVYKIRASNDTVTLTKLGMTLNGSAAAGDVTNVTLYNSSNQIIGTAQFGAGQTVATSTLNGAGLTLPADTDVKITVKADIAQIGAGSQNVATEGDVVQIDPNSAEGTGSTGTVTSGGTGSSSGARIYNSYPTFTYDTTGGNGTLNNGTQQLLALTVAADSLGDVGLWKLVFSVSTTTVSVTSPTFQGPNGNVASTSLIFDFSSATQTRLSVYFDSTSNTADATVGAGTSKTYYLGGTVAGLTTSGGAVSIALKADTAASSTMKTTTNLKNGNFVIWSPLATTTLDVNTTDWTNGYALSKGCYANVGLANDCNARTISK
jgi:hypothetical protein